VGSDYPPLNICPSRRGVKSAAVRFVCTDG